jgi:hypothetical protein
MWLDIAGLAAAECWSDIGSIGQVLASMTARWAWTAIH